jgi:hypothetical protein
MKQVAIRALLAAYFLLVTTYFSTMKMETTCSSETSVDTRIHSVLSEKIEL